MDSRVATASPSRSPPRLVLLLGLAVFINYIDRGNLATASPIIKGELHLSVTEIGILLSAFFWTYMPMQLVSGWLAERFDVGRVIAVGFTVWSVATMLTGVVSAFALLLALRLLLGLGESVSFPGSGKLLARYTAVDKRGSANGVQACGLAFGPAFGTLVGGLILERFGWRPLFISMGALSLLWLWPWLTGPARVITEAGTGTTSSQRSNLWVELEQYLEIALRREALGASLSHFCSNYSLYFLVSWLPLYLVQDRGFSIRQMAVLGAGVYSVMGGAALVSGWGLDQWIRRGATPNRAYKTAFITAQAGTALCLVGAVVGTPVVSACCLLLAGAAWGLGSPGVFAAAQTMAGPTAAGRWMGFQNCVANLAGIVGPIVTGYLVDRTGNFYFAFVLTIIVALIGMFAWTVVVPRIEPLPWPAGAALARK
jgi:MFS family permease